MASTRTTIRDAWARAELEHARRGDGAPISFSHQGSSARTLWARISDAAVDASDEGGVLLEGEARRFRIPRQDDSEGNAWAGEVSENDEIAWNSATYVVQRGWRSEHHDAVWVVTAICSTPRRAAP